MVEGNLDRLFKSRDKAIREMNRYSDILPFKDTRVILKDRGDKSDVSKYINASFVDSPL
jgi:protein tyrosine phosphatase